MDLIDQLRVFIGIARCGGFTAAAAQLGVPRPTASLAVQQLEARLGVRLLNRTTRRVSLTPDGEELLGRAGTLVEDAKELEQSFRMQGADLAGRLRVDLPTRVARRLVAPALPEFLARHPRLDVELGSSDRRIDLVHEGVDCTLRLGKMPSSSLVARSLGRVRLINCASPSYLAQHGEPRVPGDLASHFAVLYAPLGKSHVASWEWEAKGERNTIRMAGHVTVSDAETYIACCLAGLGLIQIPAFDVQEYLTRGELVEVLPHHTAAPMPVQLVYPYRRHRTRRVQAFGDWLAELLIPVIAQNA